MSKIITINSVMVSDPIPLESYIPYFNDVRIVQGDTLSSSIMGIYYGDEVNLLFWEQLNLNFGSSATYDTLYHLVSGYSYTYYAETKKFIIRDSANSIVFSNSNVQSIADFCIDFEVYSSHQLMIIISPYSDIFKFYKTVKILQKDSGGVLDNCIGVQNIVTSDRIRPYGKDDEDNPTWEFKHLAYTDERKILTLNNVPIGLVSREPIHGFKFGDFNYNKLRPNNNFYINTVEYERIVSLVSRQYMSNLLMYSILLPNLSKSMYPASQPTKNTYEAENNRPLYSPWLIWGIYNILTNYRTTDDIDPSFEINPFDLSPNWE